MGATAVNYVEITGVSTSGTTDNLGTWDTTVTVGDFSAPPSGATAVVIAIVNTSESSRWAGARPAGKTAVAYQLTDMSPQQYATTIIPFYSGSNIELYKEDAAVKFYVIGFLGSEWTWENVDAAPTIASSGGGFADRTVSTAPTGATAVIYYHLNARWRPNGETTNTSAGKGPLQIAKLDGSKIFEYFGSGDAPVWGYATGGVTFPAWLGTTMSNSGSPTLTYTADGTWRDGLSQSGAALAILHHDESSTAYATAYRADGDTWAPTLINTGPKLAVAPLSAGGAFDYNFETGYTGTIYVMAWLDASAALTTKSKLLAHSRRRNAA